MTPATLKIIGEALYGPRWQSDLARDLNIADRTMRRWCAGEDIPPGVAHELLMPSTCPAARTEP